MAARIEEKGRAHHTRAPIPSSRSRSSARRPRRRARLQFAVPRPISHNGPVGYPSNRHKRAPSIKDVAELAGVSWSTVSNVIRNSPTVRPETRARVEEAIRALGYRANAAGRQLRQGRSGNVVVAVPSLANPREAELVGPLISAFHRHDFATILEITGGDKELERQVVEGRLRYAVDGSVLLPRALSGIEIARMGTAGPLVLLGEGAVGAGVDSVSGNTQTIALDIIQYLAKQNRTAIAYVGHLATREADDDEVGLSSFVKAMRQSGLPIGSGSVITVDAWTRAEGRRAAEHIADRRNSIDAVICPDDLLAMGVLRGLQERGVSIPGDIAVVGMGGAEEGLFSTPTLTTVTVDPAEVAEVTVKTLVQAINGDDSPPTRRFVGHKIRSGESA